MGLCATLDKRKFDAAQRKAAMVLGKHLKSDKEYPP
jgi:hypothetical protein